MKYLNAKKFFIASSTLGLLFFLAALFWFVGEPKSVEKNKAVSHNSEPEKKIVVMQKGKNPSENILVKKIAKPIKDPPKKPAWVSQSEELVELWKGLANLSIENLQTKKQELLEFIAANKLIEKANAQALTQSERKRAGEIFALMSQISVEITKKKIAALQENAQETFDELEEKFDQARALLE